MPPKRTIYIAVIFDFTSDMRPFIRDSHTGTYEECERWRSQTLKQIQESYKKEWGIENKHLRTTIVSY